MTEADSDDRSSLDINEDPPTPSLFNNAGSHSDSACTTPTLQDRPRSTSSPVSSRKRKSRKRGRPAGYHRGYNIDSYTPTDNSENEPFKVGDFVECEAKRSGKPSRIGSIIGLRKAKTKYEDEEAEVYANIKIFYRHTDLPEIVYQRLTGDRNSENFGEFGCFLERNPIIQSRELFKSERTEYINADHIRSRCCVIQLSDTATVRRFVPTANTYYTLLGYNPDTRRLATIQGEIRVGSGHQAKLPECDPTVSLADRTSRVAAAGLNGGDYGEEMVWLPGQIDRDELDMYIMSVRSMVATNASMSDRQSPDSSSVTACRDETTISSLHQLHQVDYDKNRALQLMVERIPHNRSVDRRWSEDESKLFMKGLRVFGKNFFKIRKEFLPDKDTKELIEYYYYWKKAPISNIRTPGRRHNKKPSNKTSSAGSSTGEVSSESEEQDGDNDGFTCFRCDTENSTSWYYVDEHGFVCGGCKLTYRKGEEGERLPEYLFRPVEPATNRRAAMKRKMGEAPSRPTSSGREGSTEDTESRGDNFESDRESEDSRSTTDSKSSRKRKLSPPQITSTPVPVSQPIKPIAVTAPVIHSQRILPTDSVQHYNAATNPAPIAGMISDIIHNAVNSQAADQQLQQQQQQQQQQEQTGLSTVPQEPARPSSARGVSPARSDVSVSSANSYIPDTEPEPDAQHCNEYLPVSNNAHFVRVLKREKNSCTRVDMFYVPPPGSRMADKRNKSLKAAQYAANARPQMSVSGIQTQPVKPQMSKIQHTSTHQQHQQHHQQSAVLPQQRIKTEPHHLPPNYPFEHQYQYETRRILTASGGVDVIRHTSQTSANQRAIPSIGITSPRISSNRESLSQRTPEQNPARGSSHTGSITQGTAPSAHRVTTPSRGLTPRSAEQNPHPFMPPGTPALSHLSQLAAAGGRGGHMDEMMAAMRAASTPTSMSGLHNAAAAANMQAQMAALMAGTGMQGMGGAGANNALDQSLMTYRLLRQSMPPEYLERALGINTDVREKYEMALKQQDLEIHRDKMLLASAAAGGGNPLENKNFLEAAHMIDFQRKLAASGGMHGMGMMTPGGMAGLPGFPPTSLPSNTPTDLSRDRERTLPKMGGLPGSDAMSLNSPAAERLPSDRLPTDRLSGLPTHAHAHTHTHLHIHQQAEQQAQAQAAQAAQAAQQQQQQQAQQAAAQAAAAAGSAPHPGFANPLAQHLLQMAGNDPSALYRLAASGGLPSMLMNPAAAAAAGFPGMSGMNPASMPSVSTANAIAAGFLPSVSSAPDLSSQLAAAAGLRPEMDARELYMAQQLMMQSHPGAALILQQQEALHRHLADRERAFQHLPPH